MIGRANKGRCYFPTPFGGTYLISDETRDLSSVFVVMIAADQ